MRTRLPFYAPDEPPAGDPAGGDPAPAPEPGGEPSGTPAPAVDPYDDDKVQQFDRKYVEGLRREAQGLRDRHNPYKEAFDGYEDADREGWFWLAKTYRDNPKEAASAMQKVAEAILAGEDPEAAAGGAGEEGDKPLTRAEVDKLLADRDQAAGQAALLRDINSKAESLGYKEGTVEHTELLWYAINDKSVDGDLDKAHAKVEAARQAIVDKYLEDKKAETEGSPRVLRDGGEPAPASDGPKSFADARAAAEARIAQLS